MTQETAKHFAQNLLGRVKGVEKLMPSAGVDYVSVSISSDGSVRIWVSKEMRNEDTMCAMFNNYADYNAVSGGDISILDAYGNEVA